MWSPLDSDDPKSRAPVQPSPTNIQTKTRYNALKALDVYEKDQKEKPALAVHGGYCKKKHWMIIMDDSLLQATEGHICWCDRWSQEIHCLLGILDVLSRQETFMGGGSS